VTALYSSFVPLPPAEVSELHWLALLQLLRLEAYCGEERFVAMCVELCGRCLDGMCKAAAAAGDDGDGGGGCGSFPDSVADFVLESVVGVLSVACATRSYRDAKTSVLGGGGAGAVRVTRGGGEGGGGRDKDKAKKKKISTTTLSAHASYPVSDKDKRAMPSATGAATSPSSPSPSPSSSASRAPTSEVLRCSVANICAAPLLRVRKTLRASVRAIRQRRADLVAQRSADGAQDGDGGGDDGCGNDDDDNNDRDDDEDESVVRERALLERDQELSCVVAACLWENVGVGAALVPLKSATEWLVGSEAAAGGDAVSDWSSLYLGLVLIRCSLLLAERLLLRVPSPALSTPLLAPSVGLHTHTHNAL
jgi:hypothetical protein